MAIERYVAVAFTRTSEPMVRIWSEHFGEEISFLVNDLEPGGMRGWGAYPAGMCWAARSRGSSLGGINAAIVANIQVGAGVSSSAALEVSFGLALSVANGLNLDPAAIAELSHVADNEFVGIPSGIMDQYASALCRRGHALLIDCRTTDAESVPVPDDVSFVVMDTRKRRGLVDSEYADRVAACRRVAAAAKNLREGVRALRDLTQDDLDELAGSISTVDYRRAKHVIAENHRTLEAVDRLRSGDAEAFGKLMVSSHESLRDLYEVSCRELDIAVDLALEQTGCLGARMMGGGFGGCALALVKSDAVQDFVERSSTLYAEYLNVPGDFFAVRPADGVRLVDN